MFAKTIMVLCASALVAGAAGLAAASEPKGKTADPNKVVCRTVAESGSRLKKSRACHTLAEWAELKRQTRQTVEHIQDARAAHLSN